MGTGSKRLEHLVSLALRTLTLGNPACCVSLSPGIYNRRCKRTRRSHPHCGLTMIIQCFGTYDDEKYLDTGLDQDWRLWLFQVCTQWGYFTVRSFLRSLPYTHHNFASLPPGQTAPPDQNMPRIISKLLTLGYESKICKQVNLSVISVSTCNLFSVPPTGVPTRKTLLCPITAEHHLRQCFG